MGDYPGLREWAKKGDMTVEPEFAVMYSEDGGKGQKPKNARTWKKQGDNSVLKPPERM